MSSITIAKNCSKGEEEEERRGGKVMWSLLPGRKKNDREGMNLKLCVCTELSLVSLGLLS